MEVKLTPEDLRNMAELGMVLIITTTDNISWEVPPRESAQQ